jgi:hypothetical protein
MTFKIESIEYIPDSDPTNSIGGVSLGSTKFGLGYTDML